MKRIIFSVLLLSASLLAKAEDGHQLWLRSHQAAPVKVVTTAKNSAVLATARQELQQGWQGNPGATVTLTLRKDKAIKYDGYRISPTGVQASTEAGLLYGVFELLRRQQTGQTAQADLSNPSYEYRLLNHWDNPDGSVERGYAGQSIFWRKDSSFVTTNRDKVRWREYARANASVGINGAVINNVNASPKILSAEYLARVKAVADELRPYGVKTYLAVKFSSPALLGGLKTSDPLDPAVVKWWQSKAKEIYRQIPDFGGFLVKASSEGQPGPQDYGRTHADGANMLADALKPYHGLVMWRAFVYSPTDKDRAKQAYNEFVPLDGKFRDNVIVQVKNGPVDFQPREPFSPLFGAMKKTSVMPEFQITQEYLGHSTDLAFLSTMWEECLQSDTYQAGPGSTVARCTDGSVYPQKHTAMAGVANTGLDRNWTGHDFAQANWYAFGRLAWNNQMKSAQIADEWLKLTFAGATGSAASATTDSNWNTNFLAPVKQMMLDSREAVLNYSMPLGLHHIMSATRGHYGPGPWWAPPKMRADWTPGYYHQASENGVGFDRTKAGSDAVSQYHEPLASQLNNPNTCPDEYLLWFNHLPWDFKMKSGNTLWNELCAHYDKGVQQARQFQRIWDQTQPYVDAERFAAVQNKLRSQSGNAVQWKDACLLYFQQFSHMPIPATVEPPMHTLEAVIADDMRPQR
ncbi:alpha-glucuronidase [Hymenobacter gelipurpurascens]|uniref:Alpha-glucuronidase n=1 Tax=Hymenobacter gelipurpurascens TaxID=89968 RepID=A0A212T565_9BACT|nr:alpha-glucuronidase [Hymenobacter gelipurpurascens]SNC61197.1 alpha-glucuronidase [Hymenobacter gelipurpurascens]